MTALWNLGRLEDQRFSALESDLEVDVAIVGGGITGLSTAVHLLEEGRKVAVLEALRVGLGSTGNSTGNLYATLSQGLRGVRRKWGDDNVRAVVAARRAALDDIEQRVRRYQIECQFERRPLYFCLPAADEQAHQALEEEYEASLLAGLDARLADEVPGVSIPISTSLRVDNQAQHNPLRYAQELARVVAGQGGQVFENTAVVDVDAGEGKVFTGSGTVSAGHIVFATHTPKGLNLLQAEMEPSREYGVAAPMPERSLPKGIFWLLDGFHSVRSWKYEDQSWLIVIGEKHQTGHGESGEGYYRNLENYARKHFAAETFSHRWSAQQYRSADRLPYIGKSAHDNVFVATGFGADGLVWGEVSAGIICSLIQNREAQNGSLFSPLRFTPVKSAKSWASMNANVARHLTIDYFTLEKLKDLEEVAAGEGRVVTIAGQKLAVYRGTDNTLSALSPVCPHMKCIVKWNAADLSWDCPCHGSRFAIDGSVIEGPSYAPLRPVKIH